MIGKGCEPTRRRSTLRVVMVDREGRGKRQRQENTALFVGDRVLLLQPAVATELGGVSEAVLAQQLHYRCAIPRGGGSSAAGQWLTR